MLSIGGERIVYDDGRARGLHPGFDVVEPKNAIQLGHIERTVAKRDPVRGIEAGGDGVHPVGLPVLVSIGHRVDFARALRPDKHHAVRTHSQGPGAVNAVGKVEIWKPGGSLIVSSRICDCPRVVQEAARATRAAADIRRVGLRITWLMRTIIPPVTIASPNYKVARCVQIPISMMAA